MCLVSWQVPDCTASRGVSKLPRPSRGLEAVVAAGLRQAAESMDVVGADSGKLILLGLRAGRTRPQRIVRRG